MQCACIMKRDQPFITNQPTANLELTCQRCWTECFNWYMRQLKVDAHSESRTPGAINKWLYPTTESQYALIKLSKAHEDGVRKVKIGLVSCNMSVTSSVRLDKNAMNKTVQLGPDIGNFACTAQTKAYLCIDSLQKANVLLENEQVSNIYSDNNFYQLRQLRSKFHCKSTYTMRRSY